MKHYIFDKLEFCGHYFGNSLQVYIITCSLVTYNFVSIAVCNLQFSDIFG